MIATARSGQLGQDHVEQDETRPGRTRSDHGKVIGDEAPLPPIRKGILIAIVYFVGKIDHDADSFRLIKGHLSDLAWTTWRGTTPKREMQTGTCVDAERTNEMRDETRHERKSSSLPRVGTTQLGHGGQLRHRSASQAANIAR
jgi:hypothetical protein